MGHAARAGLPARARHPRRPRHGRQRRPDGVRQQGRALRDRRCVHARPVDRRARRLRRVPAERPGRGRRRRDPDAGAARAHARSCFPTRSTSSSRPPTGSRSTTATCRTSSSPSRRERLYLLQTRTAKRTAVAALKAAIGHGRRGADLARGGGRAHRAGPARAAAPPDARPARRLRRRRDRAECVTGRGDGRGRLRRGGGGGARVGGRERDPRPLGDDAGRLLRDAPRGRDPHRPRRPHLARGRRRPR